MLTAACVFFRNEIVFIQANGRWECSTYHISYDICINKMQNVAHLFFVFGVYEMMLALFVETDGVRHATETPLKLPLLPLF